MPDIEPLHRTAYTRNARPDDHAAAFDLCVAGTSTRRQAMVMANGFAARGRTDASDGCMHYVLRLMTRCGATTTRKETTDV